MRQEFVIPPAQLVCGGRPLAVADALDHLDGVDDAEHASTAPWSGRLGQLAPRRRSWMHAPRLRLRATRRSATAGPNLRSRRVRSRQP